MNLDSIFVLRLLKKNCLGINYNLFIKRFNEETQIVDEDFEMKTISWLFISSLTKWINNKELLIIMLYMGMK